MINATTGKTIKQFWSKHDTTIVFILLIIIFLFYSIFIALTLKPAINVDEERHFAVSKQFSTTIGIPPDVPETLILNATIEQNPNLYFWINGRIINLVKFFYPTASEWQLLVALRLLNVLYALGTVIFCYLFSKELIDHKWWQLLPVYLLTNTIMFVFLAGGVSDDNPTHLVCLAALYFLVRIINKRPFLTNSLTMLISLASSTLIKHRVFPFVFAVIFVWVFYIIKNYKNITPIQVKKSTIVLSIILLLLILGNLSVYGYNLLRYHSLLPSDNDILTKEQRAIKQLYLEKFSHVLTGWGYKISISESKEYGYPGPIKYFFTTWIPFMLFRIFSVEGHWKYYQTLTLVSSLLLFISMVLLTLTYWRDFTFKNLSLLGIFVFYTIVLFLYIYNYELQLKFNLLFIQGRYMFSVIDIAFVFTAKVLMEIPRKLIRIPTLVIMIVIYFITGPLTFILQYKNVFSDWLVI